MHDRSKKQPDHLPIPATRQATDPRIADGAGLGGPTLWGRWQSFSKNSPTRPGHGPRDRPLFFVHYHWPAGGMPRKSMLFPECDAKVSFAENGVGELLGPLLWLVVVNPCFFFFGCNLAVFWKSTYWVHIPLSYTVNGGGEKNNTRSCTAALAEATILDQAVDNSPPIRV